MATTAGDLVEAFTKLKLVFYQFGHSFRFKPFHRALLIDCKTNLVATKTMRAGLDEV